MLSLYKPNVGPCLAHRMKQCYLFPYLFVYVGHPVLSPMCPSS